MTDLNKLGLAEARDLLRKGETTSVELTQSCLTAIDAAGTAATVELSRLIRHMKPFPRVHLDLATECVFPNSLSPHLYGYSQSDEWLGDRDEG